VGTDYVLCYLRSYVFLNINIIVCYKMTEKVVDSVANRIPEVENCTNNDDVATWHFRIS